MKGRVFLGTLLILVLTTATFAIVGTIGPGQLNSDSSAGMITATTTAYDTGSGGLGVIWNDDATGTITGDARSDQHQNLTATAYDWSARRLFRHHHVQAKLHRLLA